jgi:hypothetical protein
MKRFIKKLLSFTLPFLIIVITVQFFDFFKIYKTYNNYFENNRISQNRTFFATKTFIEHKDSIQYNTFVFGNSRSQAFKDSSLIKHFGLTAKPFHFDSDSESLYGIYKKLEFLSLNKANLTNVLIALDASILKITTARNTYNYINPPEFNDVSKFKFYSEFIKTSCNPKFITAITDFSIFKTERRYMKKYILTAKNIDTYNRYSLDCRYGNEIELKQDSILYYKTMFSKKAFIARENYKRDSIKLTDKHIDLLQKIASILNQQNTKYRIIISPLYNQTALQKDIKNLIKSTFKPNTVFDFSGENKFTNSIGNYYEWSHYKPFVAEQLLNSINKKRALN